METTVVEPAKAVEEPAPIVQADFVPVEVEEEVANADIEMAVSESPAIQTPDHDSVKEAPINGSGNPSEEDDLNDEGLSPPPDSPTPVDDSMSQVSSSPLVNALEDEIVVGTKSNNNNTVLNNNNNNSNDNLKSSPLRVTSDQEDVEMDDAEDQPAAAQYPKRKRTSTYHEVPDEDEPEALPIRTEQEARPRPAAKPTKTHGMGGVKGVILGHWRDSQPEDNLEKHAVIGFIDIRDRLRTRIQTTTRDGRSIIEHYPLPPGPGGSWVTFEKVAFDAHLVGFNHHYIKEYVKIRAETARKDETPEEKERLDSEAIQEARRRLEANPPPETGVQPAIAYGPEIPAAAYIPNRPESKKRRMMGSFGGHTAASPTSVTTPSTRTARILLGVWRNSSEQKPDDRHAVYGILGANDMFRVKLVRETRDGRPVQGNFPQGAGALWIHWDEVEFEPHLVSLSRPEIKEYCRIRQRQIDDGEAPEAREANETFAVSEAQQFVRNAPPMGPVATKKEDHGSLPPVAIAMKGSPLANGNGYDEDHEDLKSTLPLSNGNGEVAGSAHELRQSRRNENGVRTRHSLPDVEYRAANRPAPPSALERTQSIARREIARAEAAQLRANQRAASSREVSGPAQASNRTQFQESVQRLNKVWASQEANRLKGGDEDAKMYMGIKYERKQNGPFEGKLVSQGAIISIDGEDYVEYRVLTKPTFF